MQNDQVLGCKAFGIVFCLLSTTGLLIEATRHFQKFGPECGPTDTSILILADQNNDLRPGLLVGRQPVDSQRYTLTPQYQKASFVGLTWWAFLGYIFLTSVAILGLRRKQASQTQSEERLKQALWGSEDELWNWDLASDVVHRIHSPTRFRKELPEQTGSAASAFASIHPDDLEMVKTAIEDHLIGKTEYFEAQYRRPDKQGAWHWVIDRGRIVDWAPDGSPRRLAGSRLFGPMLQSEPGARHILLSCKG